MRLFVLMSMILPVLCVAVPGTPDALRCAVSRLSSIDQHRVGHFSLNRSNTSSLEASFGMGTITLNPVGDNEPFDVSISSIAIDNRNNIVVAGFAIDGTVKKFCLTRYASDGTLDTTFGTNGVVLTLVGDSGNSSAHGVAIDGKGKILAAGYAQDGGVNKLALTRHTSSGLLDNTFGTSGIVLTSVGDGESISANTVTIDTNGKIIIAGGARQNGVDTFVLARYTNNGSLDSTFGTDGVVLTRIGDGDSASAYGVTIDSSGTIIAAGYAMHDGIKHFALAQYASNGSLDSTFGIDGLSLTPIIEEAPTVEEISESSDSAPMMDEIMTPSIEETPTQTEITDPSATTPTPDEAAITPTADETPVVEEMSESSDSTPTMDEIVVQPTGENPNDFQV